MTRPKFSWLYYLGGVAAILIAAGLLWVTWPVGIIGSAVLLLLAFLASWSVDLPDAYSGKCYNGGHG